MDTVAVTEALKKVHTEAEDVFHQLYRKASNMWSITETRRTCERQIHRTNLERNDNQTHYMITIFVPFVERALCQMEARLTNHNMKALALGFLLPKPPG